MTYKQRLFVSYYLGVANGNASEAAARAGYGSTRRSSGWYGHALLKKPKIQAAIQRKLASVALHTDEVLALLTDQAVRTFDDFLDIDSSGKWSVNLAKARRRGLLHLLSSVTQTAEGATKIELVDPFRALVQLGKYHGLWEREPAQVVDMAAIAKRVKARRLAYEAAKQAATGGSTNGSADAQGSGGAASV
jgi:hypothetical protein